MMCGKKSFIALVFLALSLSLFGQSFDPDATYPVTGAELNRLEKDLLTARTLLDALQMKNDELAKSLDALQLESANREKSLNELRGQLTTASKLYQKSQRENLFHKILIGVICLPVGYMAGSVVQSVR